jgi:hypothetical protein
MSSPSPRLKAIWAKKLKDSGFEDIEQESGMLKTWSSVAYTGRAGSSDDRWGTDIQGKIVTNYAKAEYYRLAEQFIYSHKFGSALEREIWTLHANGTSCRNIAKKLRPLTRKKLNKDSINEIVSTLTKIMLSQANSGDEDEQS